MHWIQNSLTIRIGHFARWTGWAVLWLIYHPEVHMIADWVNEPATVASSIAMYIASGVLLEFVYRKLVWGGIRPSQKPAEAIRTESLDNSWTSILDKEPPAFTELEVFCADGIIRIAQTQNTNGGCLCMAIDYEGAIKKQMQINPGNHRPTHWRINIPL
jgi:hypothetical protein